MNDMLHMVEILEDILRSDNPIAEARMQRKKLLHKLEQLEGKIFPTSVKSVFEEEVLQDVYKWFLSLPAGSTLSVGKEVIDAYWKTKLS